MNPHDVAAEMVDVHLPMNQLLHDFKTTPRAPFRSHGQLLLLWTVRREQGHLVIIRVL